MLPTSQILPKQFCLTSQDKLTVFKQALEKAKIYFNESHMDDEAKRNLLCEIDIAYAAISENYQTSNQFLEIQEELSHLFYMAGKCYYGGDMEKCRRFMQASLYFQLEACSSLLSNDINRIFISSNLDDLYRSWRQDDYQLQSELFSCVEQIPTEQFEKILKKLDAPALQTMGETYKWLGFSYQNLDTFKSATPENIARFQGIYGNAKTCFDEIDQNHAFDFRKNARWENAQLIYNTGRFMHYLEHPEDTEGALKTLDQLEPYLSEEGTSDRAQQVRAQVLNIKVVELGNAATKLDDPEQLAPIYQRCFECAKKALEISASLPNFNKFLKHMFFNNTAAFALKCGHTNYEQISERVQEAINYAKKENYNNYYFAIFFLTAAKLAKVQGLDSEMQNHRLQALQICDAFPGSTAKIRPDIEKL